MINNNIKVEIECCHIPFYNHIKLNTIVKTEKYLTIKYEVWVKRKREFALTNMFKYRLFYSYMRNFLHT